MSRKDIQKQIYLWACSRPELNAPYGVIMGDWINSNGRKCLMVTFGRARTLDATVSIYSDSFILVRTNRHGNKVFKSVDELQKFLATL